MQYLIKLKGPNSILAEGGGRILATSTDNKVSQKELLWPCASIVKRDWIMECNPPLSK